MHHVEGFSPSEFLLYSPPPFQFPKGSQSFVGEGFDGDACNRRRWSEAIVYTPLTMGVVYAGAQFKHGGVV